MGGSRNGCEKGLSTSVVSTVTQELCLSVSQNVNGLAIPTCCLQGGRPCPDGLVSNDQDILSNRTDQIISDQPITGFVYPVTDCCCHSHLTALNLEYSTRIADHMPREIR